MKKAIVLVLFFVLTGCGINQGGVSQPEKLNPVTLRLKWLHQAQFTGQYTAREKGFYEQAGLKVAIEPFSLEDPTIEAVSEGRADFGITGADALLKARSEGVPVKAIAVVYRISPVCAYTLKGNGITKPQDLIGKTVGLEPEENIEITYQAMLSRLGINRSLINEVEIGFDATELIEGRVDAATGYIINEPHQAIEAGLEVTTILAADYGANMYADVIFARDDTLKEKSDLVKRFLRATFEGWQYAIEHNDEAIDYTLKYATESTRSHETYMLKQSIPLIYSADISLGLMEEADWQQVENILYENGIIGEIIPLEELYTNEFLDAAKT